MWVSFTHWIAGIYVLSSLILPLIVFKKFRRTRIHSDSKCGRGVSTSYKIDQPTLVFICAQLIAILWDSPGFKVDVQCLSKYCICPTPCSIRNGRKPAPFNRTGPLRTMRDILLLKPHFYMRAGSDFFSNSCNSEGEKWLGGRGYPGLVRYIEK